MQQYLFLNDTISNQRFENATVMANDVTFLNCKFINCTILEGLVSYVNCKSINSNRAPYVGPWTFESEEVEAEDEGETINEINTGGGFYNEGGTINVSSGVFIPGVNYGDITYTHYSEETVIKKKRR